MKFIAKIYIAGPYSKGDVAKNVYNAINAANELSNEGFAPFVPHLTHFWHMIFSRPYDFWLDLDSQFLADCDGLLRLKGISNGADREVELAKKLKIPVFYSIEEIKEYYGK